MFYYYLSIDFGESNVGLAVSNGSLAKPLNVFNYPKSNYSFLRKYIISILEKYNPKIIIIGIPSSEKSSKRIIEIFYNFIFNDDNLKNKIIWYNEDFSTKDAILLKNKKRKREDSIAASIILDKYFNDIRFNKKII